MTTSSIPRKQILNNRQPSVNMTYSSLSSLDTKRFNGHRTAVTAVAWNMDGTRLLSSGDSSSVLLFDTTYLDQSTSNNNSTERYIHECRGDSKKISALLPSPTSPFMLSTASFDNSLNVFDTRVGTRPVHTFKLPSACLYADWSPDGNTIGICLASDTISFIDCLSWSIRTDKSKHFDNGDVNQFRWTPDGKRLLFSRYDGSCDLIEWPSLNHIISFRGNVSNNLTVACDPKSKYFAVASVDTTVSIWDSSSLTNLYTIDRRDVLLKFLSYSADGKMLAIAGDFDGVDLVDSEHGSLLYCVPAGSFVTSIAWHPSKSFLAYSTSKNVRERYNSSETGQPVCVWGIPRQQ